RLTCFRGLRHLQRSRSVWRALPSRAKSTWRIPTARTDPPDRGISSCVSSHPTANTITVLMSCTKAVTAVCVHMLAQRGLIDYDAPVARFWPEFAAKEKAAITVRDLLAHRAGLMGFEEETGISGRNLFDWKRCTAALANMEPWWKPGSAY